MTTTPQKLERVMKGFANNRRLAILLLLDKRRELMVSDIASRLNISFKSASQHLRVLSNADLVASHRVGLRIYYRLADTHKDLLERVLCMLR